MSNERRDHSYEEIRQTVLDILSERVIPYQKRVDQIIQYLSLESQVAYLLMNREGNKPETLDFAALTRNDSESFMEIFWTLFQQGVITLGHLRGEPNFPYFHVSTFGKRILEHDRVYFFHDVYTYEEEIKRNVPDIDDITLLYLQEAMQAFKSGCLLSATVMIGVAAEHTFMKLMETIQQNQNHKDKFKNVYTEKTILRKLNKFLKVLEQHQKDIPSEIKEDLETDFMGIMSVIRNFRNESGHPTGKIIGREQCYILLNLFIPYCKKLYQLIDFFRDNI